MNTNHTPGPWKWVGTKKSPDRFAYLGNPNHEHDYVLVNCDGFQPKPEDARLIASAPTLLAALEVMLEIAEQEARDTKYDNAKQTARAVIAQARGETK